MSAITGSPGKKSEAFYPDQVSWQLYPDLDISGQGMHIAHYTRKSKVKCEWSRMRMSGGSEMFSSSGSVLFSTPLNSEFSLKYECPCLIDPAVNDLDLVDLLLGYDPGRSSQCSHILLQLTRRALCDSAGRAPAVCYYARLMLSRKNL